jgi:hypothetical protein
MKSRLAFRLARQPAPQYAPGPSLAKSWLDQAEGSLREGVDDPAASLQEAALQPDGSYLFSDTSVAQLRHGQAGSAWIATGVRLAASPTAKP